MTTFELGAVPTKPMVDASRKEWRVWASRYGGADLQAALADGYPVGPAVEHAVVSALMPWDTPLAQWDPETIVEDRGDRRLPNARSYAARDSLVSQALNLPRDMVPEGTTVEVGRIRSVVVAGSLRGERRKRTAVPVTVTSPHHTAVRYYLVVEAA